VALFLSICDLALKCFAALLSYYVIIIIKAGIYISFSPIPIVVGNHCSLFFVGFLFDAASFYGPTFGQEEVDKLSFIFCYVGKWVIEQNSALKPY
jgi:hypothetical protein